MGRVISQPAFDSLPGAVLDLEKRGEFALVPLDQRTKVHIQPVVAVRGFAPEIISGGATHPT
ncbi:MAG: hypothetical protein AB3N06_01135 [Erythrobacter sp.]